jgi:hypothetical protein
VQNVGLEGMVVEVAKEPPRFGLVESQLVTVQFRQLTVSPECGDGQAGRPPARHKGLNARRQAIDEPLDDGAN